MASRLLSTLIAGALVFFTIAGAGGVAAISSDHLKLEQTDRPLDVAISGPGYFCVRLPDADGGGVAYTRQGRLFVNTFGQLVVGSDEGLPLEQCIALPANATDIAIAADGMVSVAVRGEKSMRPVGRIELTVFPTPSALRADPKFKEVLVATPAAGIPAQSLPATDGAGQLLQGYRESAAAR